jgi:Ca2+-transporting ATPase
MTTASLPITTASPGLKRPADEGPAIAATETKWYGLSPTEAASRLQVDPARGLSTAEAQTRLQRYGPNILEEAAKEPRWKAFLKQYNNLMQYVLLGMAIGSALTGDWEKGIFLLLLTLLIAWMGLSQESKAAASVAALSKAMKTVAKVRRDGAMSEVSADQIVPGDVALVDAGDRVPADGRVILAATLQIEEGALTGESVAVDKLVDTITKPEVPLGDRVNLAFMNTNVTRGHAEILVTDTGMNTEVGHIATMLSAVKPEKTPLTKQVDRLTVIIVSVSLLAFLVIVVAGLAQGEAFAALFAVGVSMMVGSIPAGLPVVVTTMLSQATVLMAKKNAVMKELPAVETLGSTSAINSDKTGTLTLNQMTVREMFVGGHRFTVTGEGYSTQGAIRYIGETQDVNIRPAYIAMALDTDAVLDDGKLVGDPTEGALIVLAEKGGVDVKATRELYPRIAMVPFDSDYKFMTTFHRVTDRDGKQAVIACVKGAPDVLLARSSQIINPQGKPLDLTEGMRQRVMKEGNDYLAGQGMRVLAFAGRRFDGETFDPNGDLFAAMHDLVFYALIGIVDPPRPEARVAIAEAHKAGIQVRMITGDHAVTAAAIAKELGIPGRAVTGAEFAALSDEEAARQVPEIGVIARVAPEHKVRLVNVLRGKGHIVAMTGDGVNDAPAIKAADIGVAMGITGTDVAKGAARMILADDNFATIVKAVEEGRVIYDNLRKYLRVQLLNMFMFIMVFLGSAVFAAPFTTVQVLWVPTFVVCPIGILLGADLASLGIMQRKPRAVSEQIIPGSMMVRLILVALFMAASALILIQIGMTTYGSVSVGQSMGVVALCLLNIVATLNLRFPEDTAFRGATFSNKALLVVFVWVILSALIITELPLMQQLAQTTSLTVEQWELCLVPAVILLIGGEIYKAILRARRPKVAEVVPVPPTVGPIGA